jgi:hypothetical protein
MSDYSYDFGVFPDIEIGDRLWNDVNADGIQNPGEFGLMNINLDLLDGTGTVIGTGVTDAFGNYIFTSNATTGSTLGYTSNLILDI